VPPDGNCLFHAVGVAHAIVTGQPQPTPSAGSRRARELRLQANDMLCPGGAPAGELNGFPVELIIEPIGGEGGKGYCSRLRRDGQWGSAAEILALTKSLHCPIVVHHRPHGAIVEMETYGLDEPGPKVRILYLHSSHYAALRQVESARLQRRTDSGELRRRNLLSNGGHPDKPDFTNPAIISNRPAQNRAIKARMRTEPDFRERVEAWDARRKRIESRLGGKDSGVTVAERLSAGKAWLRHVGLDKHAEERDAVLIMWEDPAQMAMLWDTLREAQLRQRARL
jgi:hypothetical protein